MMNKNIIILLFLGLMLIAGIIAVRSYNQVEKQIKENLALVIKLKEKDAVNEGLKQQTDSITRELTKLLSGNDSGGHGTNSKWDTEKTTLIRKLKIVNEEYTKSNNQSAYQKAYDLEKEGFEALVNDNFDLALEKITLAEKTSPGFHMCFEISELLKKKQKEYKDPLTQKEIKQQIIEKYSWKAPAESLNLLKSQVKRPLEKPVINAVKWPVKKNN